MKEMEKALQEQDYILEDYIESGSGPTSPSSSCWRNGDPGPPLTQRGPALTPSLAPAPTCARLPVLAMLQEGKRRKLSPWDVHLHAHRSCPILLLAQAPIACFPGAERCDVGFRQEPGSILRVGMSLGILSPTSSTGLQRC